MSKSAYRERDAAQMEVQALKAEVEELKLKVPCHICSVCHTEADPSCFPEGNDVVWCEPCLEVAALKARVEELEADLQTTAELLGSVRSFHTDKQEFIVVLVERSARKVRCAMKCSTCGRRPSERVGVKRATYDVVSKPCPDPIHDLADEAPALTAEVERLVPQRDRLLLENAELCGDIAEALELRDALKDEVEKLHKTVDVHVECVSDAEAERDAVQAELAEAVARLRELDDYDGGASNALEDEYVTERRDTFLSRHPAPSPSTEGGSHAN